MVSKVHLLIIDPQIDFTEPGRPLYVPGADNDMRQIVKLLNFLIERNGPTSITVSLDSHSPFTVSHPCMFINSEGQHPEPFIQIHLEDVFSGTWQVINIDWYTIVVQYLKFLQEQGKSLTIWPPHCIVGSSGHAICPVVNEAIIKWEMEFNWSAVRLLKGLSQDSDQFSIFHPVFASLADRKEAIDLASKFAESDLLLVCGEAASHCVIESLESYYSICERYQLRELGTHRQVILLTDATSSVPGYEEETQKRLDKLQEKGLLFSTVKEILNNINPLLKE